MDRRDFLSAYKKPSLKEASFIPFDVARTTSGLSQYTGAWTQNEVVHLLKRTMFGSKKSDIDYFKTKTMSQAVDELLNPTAPLPAPPVKEYDEAGATVPDTTVPAGTTWVNNVTTDVSISARRRSSFRKWWMGNMINQDRSIREKMTLFWHNHFSTEMNDVGNAQYIYKHHALLRASALGNFKTLVRAVTIDPAMLSYLNGSLNTATAPDENYGRELQELFCCGKGPNSLYTESDVKEAAKVLTGWRNNSTTVTSYFDASRHHTGNKQFSAFYNNTIITGRTGATAGELELEALLNMIFNVQEVSKYICRRLYRWFVYYRIDAAVESNVIEPLAAALRNNNYEIKPVLNLLLKSEHFFDVLNQGCQIKSPVDKVVGLCREFDVQFQPATDYINNYGLWNLLNSQTSIMQQTIGDPPDVSGWKAYYQEPQFYEIWINSDTLPKRNQFTDSMVATGYTFSGKRIMIDVIAFAKTLPNPSDPNALISDALQILYRMPLTTASRNQIKTDILLVGQATDYYWTEAWTAHINNPSNTTNATIVRNRLRDLFKYFMNLAEYQLA
jgi:uncharacterized protein (DUF1800 family)